VSDGSSSYTGQGVLERWLLGPVSLQVMVLNRIVLGGVLFLHAASRAFELPRLYGEAGATWSPAYRAWVDAVLAPDLAAPLLALVAALAELSPEMREVVVIGLYTVLLGSSLAFASGLFTRGAGIVAVVLHMLFVTIHPFAHYGWASLVSPLVLYVVLSRAGDHLSIDAWRRRRRGLAPLPAEAPAWPMRLLQIHIAAMYFHTGFARIDDPLWLEGQALFEALARTLFTRFTFELHVWSPLLVLLTWAVFLLEPLAAIFLWVPRLRTLCALALIAMHVVLEILTNVGWWNFIMIAGLLAFLPPPWVARALPEPVPASR
jgi:hypothetical protein